MMFTWSLTLTAFIMIFIDVDGWSKEELPHALLGTITTMICFLHPILASFRPTLDSPKRKYFNMGHAFGGSVAQILAREFNRLVNLISGLNSLLFCSNIFSGDHLPGRQHGERGTPFVALLHPWSVRCVPGCYPWGIYGRNWLEVMFLP